MKVYKIKVNGKSYRVELEEIEQVDTAPIEEKRKQETKKIVNNDGGKEVVSPIQGQVTNIKVKVGDKVQKGDVLLIIEAMKLMNEIEADASGKVTEICVKNGDSIEFGQVLMYVE